MIRYDLLKAQMLMELVKLITELKGKNPTDICNQYSQLALKAAQTAHEILSKDEVSE